MMLGHPERWRPSSGISLEGTALEVVKSDFSLSVLAGPGAGKTELLAQRAAYLLNTGLCPPPKRILAITFKQDAARNLQDRVSERSELDAARRFESLTLHAFAKRTLDQFREALEPSLRPSPNYKIVFPSRHTWEAFQRAHGVSIPEIRSLNAVQLANVVRGVPDFDAREESPNRRIRQLWWKQCLQSNPSTLTFDMIIPLASHIVGTQPIVKNAIVSTYTHVFLDEFQDVTQDQYDLIREIFKDGPAVITAVGDTNQAIMRWAGALPDIFTRFDRDFSAANRRLQFNYRSNSRIVDLINDLSKLADAESLPTESARKDAGFPADAVEGWIFPTRAAEGQALARFVRDSISSDPALEPQDFVILTRMRADDVEARLAPYFAESGLRLRNDARTLGPLTIQDLVKEPVFNLVTAIFKMAHGVRTGSPFQVCGDILAGLEGIDLATERGTVRVHRLIQELVAAAVAITKDLHPREADFRQLMGLFLPNERRERLTRAYKDYQSREYLDSIIEGLALFFAECGTGAASWPTFIHNAEGKGVVKIMTIYKSKGLEYHTVIFVEFNDDAFWKNDDDVNVFFVALSRARERIRFSLTRDSRGFNNVDQFLKALIQSGVEFKNAV